MKYQYRACDDLNDCPRCARIRWELARIFGRRTSVGAHDAYGWLPAYDWFNHVYFRYPAQEKPNG